MASQRYVPLRMIIIAVCLDISFSILVTAVPRNSETPRHDSYNLDKGPVVYEAYYPDTRESYEPKRDFDQSTVLETSFQVPSDRFGYSTETVNRPVGNNESSIVENNERRTLSKEQRKEIRRNHNFANEFVPSRDEQSSAIFDEDKNTENVNKEISELARRAISRDLESWNLLERYLERANDRSMLQAEMRLKKNHEDEKDYSYPSQVYQRAYEPSTRPSSKVLRKLETRGEQELQPTYLEEVDASENVMKDKTTINNVQTADTPPVNVISGFAPENIFQPRPQLITYTFFRKLTPRLNEQVEKVADDKSTPRNYGDNLIREEIADDSSDKQVKEDIKITSIEVSKLPRHKTRHHHDEWPKRDYPSQRHRSQSAVYPINKEK